MHQAVQLAHSLDHIVFPNTSLSEGHQESPRQFTPLDSRILENIPQRDAISAILALQGMSPPYIVFGP